MKKRTITGRLSSSSPNIQDPRPGAERLAEIMTKEKHKLTPQQAEEILAKMMKDSADTFKNLTMKFEASVGKDWTK
jgi:DNA polymerase I-like protein with 3'-5' exonuclease and polymerase domains